MRANPSAATCQVTSNQNLPSSGTWVWRLYVRFATLPSADTNISTLGSTFGIRFKQADSKLYCYDGAAFGASGAAVTTGVWYRLDVKAAGTTLDAQVDGASLGQVTIGVFSASFMILGAIQSCTADIFFDQLAVSQTAADYPLGAGYVLGFVPASDGAHTSTGTDIVKGTAAAPTGGGAITSATTDSFNWVNARPIGGGATDATRLINQQTAATAEYVEHGIEQTTEVNAPIGVEVLAVRKDAATTNNSVVFKVADNGTEDVVYTRTSAAGVTSDTYATKHYATMPNGGTAWTLTRFKALKLRFGYSGDATPDTYLRGWMVEAAFPPAAPAATSRPLFQPPLRRITRRRFY